MTDLEQNLADHLSGLAGLDDRDDEPAWENDTPPGAAEADTVLYRRARALREIADIDRLADQQINRIRQWVEDRRHGPARLVERCDQQLEAFARAQHHANPKALSHNLPNGILALRAARPRVVIDDDTQLLEWAAANLPALVETKQSVPKQGLAKLPQVDMSDDEIGAHAQPGIRHAHLVDPDGVPVPGVHVETPTDPTFTIRETSR